MSDNNPSIQERTPDEVMRGFITEVGRERASARAQANTHTPIRQAVTDVRTSTPASPHLFKSPEKHSRREDPQPTAAVVEGVCPFGQLTRNSDGDWLIIGGAVTAGNKNFNVPNYEIATAGSPPDKLIYIEVPVEGNRDDAGEIFLSGIKTSSATSLSMQETTSTSYPNNTALVVTTGLGQQVLPIGQLTVIDGTPSFAPTGCGEFFLNQCGGAFLPPRSWNSMI